MNQKNEYSLLFVKYLFSVIYTPLLALSQSIKLRADPGFRCYKCFSCHQTEWAIFKLTLHSSHFTVNLTTFYPSVNCDWLEFFGIQNEDKTLYFTLGRILKSHNSTQLDRNSQWRGFGELHCVADENILHFPNGPYLLRSNYFSFKIISFLLLTFLVISLRCTVLR